MKRYLLLAQLTLLIFPLFAQTYSGGTGTASDPYLIATKADLKYLSDSTSQWSYHFKQTANIYFTSVDFSSTGAFYNNGMGFSPIGNDYYARFTGSYNGNGFSIDSLYINRPTYFYVGLFGFSEGANFDSITLSHVTIIGKEHIGSLVGCCALSGNTISNCSASGSVSGVNVVGGLVGSGSFGTTLSNSYATANVTGSNYDVGGLVGLSQIIITKCYATGSINGGSFVGGLVGCNMSSIFNSYAIGNVIGSDAVGGLVGVNNEVVSGMNNGSITNSYAIGSVTGNTNVGGLVGWTSGNVPSPVNSFWDTQTSGQSTSTGGIGQTTAQMQTQSTFTSATWDFIGETANGTDEIWQMSTCSYPVFSWQATITPSIASQTHVTCFGGTNGTATIHATGGVGNTSYVWPATGDSTATITGLAAGTYTCIITDEFTCTQSINVTINEPTPITSSQTRSICAGEILTVGSNTYTVSGTYVDTLTATTGCDSIVQLNLTVYPISSTMLTHSICQGEGFTFGTQILTHAGTYNDTLISTFGCDSIITINLTVFDSIDTITTTNEITITASQTSATYQWIDCNNGNAPISGETNQWYTATTNGSYAVVITKNGCSDTSACIPISTVGLNNLSDLKTIRVYPNPSTGLFHVLLDQTSTITITNLFGKVVHTETVKSGGQQTIDLQSQPNGIYFMQITTSNQIQTVTLVKQ